MHVPSLPAIENLDLALLAFKRHDLCQSSLGRALLLLRFQLRRLQWRLSAETPDVTKRLFDIVVSLVLLIALIPLFALVALLIKFEDGGPIFFAQSRVGQNGKLFKMFKIRSMCLDAEEKLEEVLRHNHHKDGVTFKLKQDPRITRIGRWLRKFSVDELPQLFNVLIGDMSLVGPRPPVPREVAMYSLADRRRLGVRPGITCIWQVSGRSEIDFSDQVLLDVKYIEQRSFFLDLCLLVRTIPAVLSTKGAC
ncbi:MAG TPA: sugar transferase [Clostridia bacterium]|nr:sugar transferase [Clostridia bacterium]